MGNIRVHELAKSLGVETSKVLSALEAMGVKATNMSGVDEETCAKIRRKLSPSAQPTSDGEQKSGQESRQEAAPKKKRIVAVFRPQNSRSGMMKGRSGAADSQRDHAARPHRKPEQAAPAPEKGNAAAQRRPASPVRSGAARPAASRSGAVRKPETPKPRVHFRGALTGSTSAEDLLKEGGSSIAAQQARAQMKADERPLSESATRKPEEEARIAAQKAREEAAAKAAEEAARKAAEAEAVRAAAEAARKADEERARAEAEKQKAAAPVHRAGQGSRDAGAGQVRSTTQRARQGQSFGGDRKDASGRTSARQGSSASRRDGSLAAGRGDRSASRPSGQGAGSRGGYSQRGGAAAPGSGRSDAPGKSFGGRKGTDKKAAFDSKNTDRQRSVRGKNDRDKSKDKYNRFDQDDRVVTSRKKKDPNRSRKKKDPNRAGAFHKPEPVAAVQEEQIKTITLPDVLTLRDLADKMKLQPSALIKKLFLQGKMVTLNQELTQRISRWITTFSASMRRRRI